MSIAVPCRERCLSVTTSYTCSCVCASVHTCHKSSAAYMRKERVKDHANAGKRWHTTCQMG